jgi:hypothetical protein
MRVTAAATPNYSPIRLRGRRATPTATTMHQNHHPQQPLVRAVRLTLAACLALSTLAHAQTDLFHMDAAMRHASDPARTEIQHQELFGEGSHQMKYIGKNTAGANRAILANGSAGAWGDLVLEHTVGVQWESWIEFMVPASFPAKGMDDTLVIETTFTIGSSDEAAGTRYNIGISGRTHSNYNNVIFWPNVFSTGIRPTAADAGVEHTLRFEVQPTMGTATVILNGEQLKQLQLAGNDLTFLTADDLGFVRIYYQSLSATSGADNTPLGATQTFTIGEIRVYRLGDDPDGNGGNGGPGDEEPGVITPLFSVDAAIRHATNPQLTEVAHGEFFGEEGSTLKNVNQRKTADGIRTLLLDGTPTDGFATIQLQHKEAVQWNSWLEYQVQPTYPAAGANHKLVFETKYSIASSDPSVNLTHSVGFAARDASNYSNTIFLPDRMTVPFAATAAAAGRDNVVQFVIEPAKGLGTVFLNGEQVNQVTLAEPALTYITNSNLGFVRIYYKSAGAGGGNDGSLLGATQTWDIDYVKAYVVGEPVVSRPSFERVYFDVDQALYNLLRPGTSDILRGDRVRQGKYDVAYDAGLAGVTAKLITPTALGHHAIEISQQVVANGETTLGFAYPFDYPAKGRADPLIIDVRAAILAAGGNGLTHGITLSAEALNAGQDPVIPAGVFGVLPRATTGGHGAWTAYRFEIRPADGVAVAYQGTTVLQTYELPAAAAALLRDYDLTRLRLHFHSAAAGATQSGLPLGGSQTFQIDRLRVYQRASLIGIDDVQAAFAAAAPGARPRVLTTPTGLAEVNALSGGEPMVSSMLGGVLSTANSLSATNADGSYTIPPRGYALDEAQLRIPNIHAFHNPVGNLAVAYGLTGKVEYAERIWAQIDMMNAFPDWGANRHFLDTGVAAANYAIAYDFLKDWLTEPQQDAMWLALREKALIPALNQMRGRAWWHRSAQNWNAVVHGGLIMAALAWYEREPELCAEIVSLAGNGLTTYIDEFYPDGQTVEGGLYWGYGMSYLSMGLEAMANVLGTDFGLSDSLGLERTRYFPMLIAGPVATLNFGDDNIKSGVGETQLWLARRYGDGPLLRSLYEKWQTRGVGDWRDLMWFRPTDMAEQATGPAQLDNYVRGQEVISLIDDWTDPKALFVAIHGGENAASHGHLDAGSFYIQAAGGYFAFGNLGGDDYNSPGFFTNNAVPAYNATANITVQGNQSRWHFYNTRAEGKNAMVFKPRATPGDVRPDQDPNGYAIVKAMHSTPGESSAILNLQPAYGRDVSAYERGIRLWNNRSIITVRDEFQPKADSTAWWFMHTRSPILLSDGGRTARLGMIAGGSLIATIRSPQAAVFTTMNSPLSYLPGSAFPQTDNRQIPLGMRKLMIRLEVDAGVTETIAVDFRVDTTPEPTLPWLPTLSEWGTQTEWSNASQQTESLIHSSWMGWLQPLPGGWHHVLETSDWVLSLPYNTSDSFTGWSAANNGWFWTSSNIWPWAYVYASGTWTYMQTP